MHMRASTPIPWVYSDLPGILMWTWVSDHFVAKITGTEVLGGDERTIRSYSWELADLMKTNQGLPRVLVEGVAGDFDEADGYIREHVGKCYDPRLGYQQYAGSLANTFTLASGERVDVSALVGSRCTVTVLMADGSTESAAGDFSVHHYMWRLRNGDEFLEIRPEHCTHITNRSAIAEKATALAYPETYIGIGRIYRTEHSAGCTGTPGFTIGTVDHAGAPKCPVHEAALPADLLR